MNLIEQLQSKIEQARTLYKEFSPAQFCFVIVQSGSYFIVQKMLDLFGPDQLQQEFELLVEQERY